MDGQHGLPVVGPAVRSAGVAKAVRVELWRPRVDDGANAVALKKMLDVVGCGGKNIISIDKYAIRCNKHSMDAG